MMKTKPIPFAEFRGLLERLGFVEKSHPTARVFLHPDEGLLAYRRYLDDDAVESHDIVYTRKFLDLRGVMDAVEFDSTFQRADTPA
jgi:hypothetical protein